MSEFTFAEIEGGFDNHIEKSIRGYDDLHKDVINLSRYFVEDNTFVVDVGCSTGRTIDCMMKQNNEFAPLAEYIGIEKSKLFEPYLKRERIINSNVGFILGDVKDYEFRNCSLVTSLFTLQFMPIRDRSNIIENIYHGLNKGGAFIFSEKISSEYGKVQDMMTFSYYDYKKQYFSEFDIMTKETQLRNMLKPNTWLELKVMLENAGFSTIQPFWQNFLFIGVLCIK